MNEAKRSLKEKAQRAIAKGQWEKAFEPLSKYCCREPKDLRSRLKMANVLERLGRRKEAIQEYRRVAERYAANGLLLQAISINKMILRMNPSLKEVNDRLAQLYTARFRENELIPPFSEIPLFSELTSQELRFLVSEIQSKTFQQDEVVCGEGQDGDSLMVISRGKVGIFKHLSKGRELLVRTLGEGDFFGEFGFFTDHKRHATVRALMPSEIFEISRDVLNRILHRHPRVEEVLLHFYEERVLDLFLSVSPLLRGLSPSERDEILGRFHPISLPEDTLIFNGGDSPRSLYLIKNGEVEIFLPNPKGRRVVLSNLKSGDFFGEIGPLLNRPRMASARTTRPSELLELKKEDLEAFLHQYPKMRESLMEISRRRLTQVNPEVLSQRRSEKVREAMV